ncbi:hypothetical protein [Pseudodesulfovibrio tunisiensis]|uniref:hypothetical protein n=1 Tax=Pseudodesulfovibrio tunisiensis TaxID=463192 RepID=UPI001FB2E9E2|nr:hypothetical protein [Pseudodesulfovibrio tunisiensis]
MGIYSDKEIDELLGNFSPDWRKTLLGRDPEVEAENKKVGDYVSWYNQTNPDKPISIEDIPDRSGFWGGASELVHGIGHAVVDQFPEDVARISRGGDVDPETDTWEDRWIAEQKKDRASRVLSRQVILGDKVNEALAQGPASVVTSAATGVSGALGGGKIGAAIGAPFGPPGVAGGALVGSMVGAGTTSGVAFYRLAKDQFLEEMYDLSKKNNADLTPEEWEEIKKDIDDEATQYGLWEAGPEALSQAFTAGLFKGVGGKLLGKIPGVAKVTENISKRALTRAGAKISGELVEEEATEFATYMGQEGIRKDMGLRKDDPSLGEFVDTQAGPVAVGSALQLGAHKVGAKLYDRLSAKGKETAEDTAPSMPEGSLALPSGEAKALPFVIPQQTEKTGYGPIVVPPQGMGGGTALPDGGPAPRALPQAPNTYPPIPVGEPRNGDPIETYSPNFETVYTPDHELVPDAQRRDLPVPYKGRRQAVAVVQPDFPVRQSEAENPREQSAFESVPDGVVVRSSGEPYRAKGAEVAAKARTERTGKPWETVEYQPGKWGVREAPVKALEEVVSSSEKEEAAPFENAWDMPEGEIVSPHEPLSTERSPQAQVQESRDQEFPEPKVEPLAQAIPEGIRVKSDGKPYSRKGAQLAATGKSRSRDGRQWEPVQIEGDSWGIREKVEQPAPRYVEDAEVLAREYAEQGKTREQFLEEAPEALGWVHTSDKGTSTTVDDETVRESFRQAGYSRPGNIAEVWQRSGAKVKIDKAELADIEKAAKPADTPAPKAKPKSDDIPPDRSYKLLGRNRDNRNVYADGNGVRAVEELPDILTKQSVSMTPGGGMHDSAETLYQRGKHEFLTKEEVAQYEASDNSGQLPDDMSGDILEPQHEESDHDNGRNRTHDHEFLVGELSEDREADRAGRMPGAEEGVGQNDASRDGRPDEDRSGRSHGVDRSAPHLSGAASGSRPAVAGPTSPGKSTRDIERAKENPGNFFIEEDFGLGQGTDSQKIRNNLEAIRILRRLQEQDRPPSPG